MTQQKPGDGLAYPVEQEDTLLPFLLAHVKGKSRNNIKSLLSRRQVRVDGRVTTRFDHPLMPGQRVSIQPPESMEKGAKPPFPILYEDGELLAVDKPAGLLTIATQKERERTAYHLAREYVEASGAGRRIFIVHRLDRDTSGVLVFAKDEGLKLALQEQWEDLAELREYLAVVEGELPERSGVCHTWLRETVTHLVYSGERRDGKEAITHYKVLAERDGYSLVRVRIDTGRKNQIRVHMRELGHPVAGDKKYGAGTDPMGRLGLHASRLAFRHPRTGELLRFQARLPREFRRLFPDIDNIVKKG